MNNYHLQTDHFKTIFTDWLRAETNTVNRGGGVHVGHLRFRTSTD